MQAYFFGMEEPMLTEEDRARIRAEEIFRVEVRRGEEADKLHPSGRTQVWLFLNSSLGVWVLSFYFSRKLDNSVCGLSALAR
jgi:hypothetical protein